MDTAPWPKEIVVKPMEEIMITNTASATANTCSSVLINKNHNTKPQPSTSLERKVRPHKEQALNCPRCNSTNTKFCYYNNYSLTQPRYFCKTCRRYWTEGGTLRNIPVGGGSRKNKRSTCSSSSSTASKIKLPHFVVPSAPGCTNPNPKIHGSCQDLNLGFPSTLSEFMQLPNMETPNNPHHQYQKNAHISQTSNASHASSHLSSLELLTGFSTCSRGSMTHFMPMQIPDPNSAFPISGFSLPGDFKPTLNFSLDRLGGRGGLQGVQESPGIGGRTLFPFEDAKSTTTTTTATTVDDHHHHQNHNSDKQSIRDDQQGDSTGYWTGMLGGAVSCFNF